VVAELSVIEPYVEKASVEVLPRKSCKWETPGCPGKTIGSSGRLCESGQVTSQPPLVDEAEDTTVGVRVGVAAVDGFVGVLVGEAAVGTFVGVLVGAGVGMTGVGACVGTSVGVRVGVGRRRCSRPSALAVKNAAKITIGMNNALSNLFKKIIARPLLFARGTDRKLDIVRTRCFRIACCE